MRTVVIVHDLYPEKYARPSYKVVIESTKMDTQKTIVDNCFQNAAFVSLCSDSCRSQARRYTVFFVYLYDVPSGMGINLNMIR
jgi:hypothetical protein